VSVLVPVYRNTGSPLHVVRPSVGLTVGASTGAIALLAFNPIVLAGDLVAVLAVGAAAGVLAELRRAAVFGISLGLLIALVNAITSSEGLTVLVQGPVLPVIGRLDVTVEAIASGAVKALRILIMVLAAALFSTTVDPDRLLRSLRRVSVRSALTASLATRLVPTIARDALRLRTAYRLRADRVAGKSRGDLQRAAILTRALAAGALERSLDIAAALEVRGFGLARRARRAKAPWSRHDVAFSCASLTAIAIVLCARVVGDISFAAYPQLDLRHPLTSLSVAVAVPAIMLSPFALARFARFRYRRATEGIQQHA
jgi:energy-coupling factor transport system permease protein